MRLRMRATLALVAVSAHLAACTRPIGRAEGGLTDSNVLAILSASSSEMRDAHIIRVGRSPDGNTACGLLFVSSRWTSAFRVRREQTGVGRYSLYVETEISIDDAASPRRAAQDTMQIVLKVAAECAADKVAVRII